MARSAKTETTFFIILPMSESDSDLDQLFKNFHISKEGASACSSRQKILRADNIIADITSEMAQQADQVKALVETAVSAALAAQREWFEQRLTDVSQRLDNITLATPEVETYREITIIPGRQCEESLDIVKSLPEFDGKQENYVSWRQAAHTAYKIFEAYEGSSKHYQAVAIIRNKIRGPADMTLASFNTVLNFKAIISRLDFTYSDKRPIYLIEQELSTLRQGHMTLLQFFDEVERKLTLLTNKTIMTYEKHLAASLNEKYRMDALRVFISGTKKPLCDVLFSARPSDLHSALALAQEVESNHERYLFASNYARSLEEKALKADVKRSSREKNAGMRNQMRNNPEAENPHLKHPGFSYKNSHNSEPVQAMEVDSSTQYRQSTQQQSYDNQGQRQWQAKKRFRNVSDRFTGPKLQRVNHLSHEDPHCNQTDYEYQAVANSQAQKSDDELSNADQINFLGNPPYYRSLKEQ